MYNNNMKMGSFMQKLKEMKENAQRSKGEICFVISNFQWPSVLPGLFMYAVSFYCNKILLSTMRLKKLRQRKEHSGCLWKK